MRQGIEHEPCPFMIAHLPFAEQQDQGLAVLIGDGVQFRVQAAFGAADASGNSPFLRRLAAVRCALRCVASMKSRSGLRTFPARMAKMRLNTPVRLGANVYRERQALTFRMNLL